MRDSRNKAIRLIKGALDLARSGNAARNARECEQFVDAILDAVLEREAKRRREKEEEEGLRRLGDLDHGGGLGPIHPDTDADGAFDFSGDEY